MGFGDLRSEAGLKALNDFVATRSYIESYVPSQADIVVFRAVGSPPQPKFNHALRWFNHIASYSSDEQIAFPGVQRCLDDYGSCAADGGASAANEDDDDFDLFGSDDEEEDDDQEKLKEERVAAYTEKKQKKAAVIAKSNILLDVKPWGDDTDLEEMERLVRSIVKDGLLWGASKLKPVAFGIKKLQISCVVEDEKVGTDFLEEAITEFEDHVQSVDIAAFNKV